MSQRDQIYASWNALADIFILYSLIYFIYYGIFIDSASLYILVPLFSFFTYKRFKLARVRWDP